MALYKLNSKHIMLSAALLASTLPFQSFAENDSSERRRVQNAGYLGKLSKDAIATQNLERLRTGEKRSESRGRSSDRDENLKARVNYWHNVALDAVALDHTPIDGEAPAEQAGPTRTSRALSMVHIGMFEVLNTLDEDYQSYLSGIDTESDIDDASEDAALATIAHTLLSSLYPSQSERLAALYADDMELIEEDERDADVEDGVQLAEEVAELIILMRDQDGSEISEPSFGQGGAVADGEQTFFGTLVNGGTDELCEWQPDPNTPEFAGEHNLSLGAYWGAVTPFVLSRGDQFRSSEPPLPGDDEYEAAYVEVASLGGAADNELTPSTGTDESHFIGNYWGYDGVPLIGVPPRIYNQIASQVSAEEIDDALEYARFLALINVAMADTAIAAWDSKYFYNYWRPVTGIRVDDDDPDTVTDPSWDPVGVSVINTQETIRATPPFPAYPSGHAAFGASVFEIMRAFFGDDTAFTFISDEFNGEGVDPFSPDQPRPLVPVRFSSFTEAQEENGRSRVYNGVHWRFDDSAGQQMGVSVAQYLLESVQAFQERDSDRDDDRRGRDDGRGRG